MLCLIRLNYFSFIVLRVLTGDSGPTVSFSSDRTITDALSLLSMGLLVCVLLFKVALLYRQLMYGSMALEHFLLKKTTVCTEKLHS